MWRQAAARPVRAWASPKITQAIPSGSHVQMYQIKVKPGTSAVKKLAVYMIVGGVCYIVWGGVMSKAMAKLEPGPLPFEAPPEKDMEPIFLPIPFTGKQVTPLPYAGAEEEWKNFVKFNKDEKLKERVKNDLKMVVKRAAEKNPTTKRWAKNGESFQLGTAWLIMSFPERPPPEFVRTGIELGGPKGIEIKEKKIDPRTKAIIDRVLIPYPIASASYAFFKAMTVQNVSTVAKYIGLTSGGKDMNTSSPDPEIEKTLKKLQAKQTAGGSTASTKASSTPTQTSETPVPKTPAEREKITPSSTSDRPLPKAMPDYLMLAGSGPWAAFKQAYSQTWKPLKYSPPRGSLAVHGMVSLESPKGRVYIDVFAWYHPKTEEFHWPSLVMNLKSITPHNQKPRR